LPIYEYTCNDEKCKQESFEEIFYSMSEAENAIVKCPTCGKEAKRIMSGSSFRLKGDCWEKDGYTRDSFKID
jgi:putative FmdB family regulatory protein